MAESIREEARSNNLSNDGLLTKIECAVCLQTCVHPAELPCGHIFCYLCIKGIVNQGRRCAMCRQDIPVDYLDKPLLLNPVDTELPVQGFEDGHLWFYEGHNGWWQYDERTTLELESAYQKGERCCDLLIAGFLYIADFDGMLQYRRNDPSRRRRIKRDLATTLKKGIAGLKATKSSALPSLNSSGAVANDVIQNVSTSSVSNSLGGLQIFSSGSNNSRGSDSLRLRAISTGCSPFTCRPPGPTNTNSISQTDSSVPYSLNLNLDNAIHDTLDWTIEQIESLNLELLNDYESLFRDVNSYGQLQNNLNQTQFRRTPNNYMSRYLNVRDSTSEIVGSGLSSTVSNRPISSSSDLCDLPVGSPNILLEETDNIYSHVLERPLNGSLESNAEIPQPPLRSGGMSRSRPRSSSLRQSTDLSSDTLFQKFTSNK